MHQPYPWPEGKRAAFVFSMDVDSDSPWAWINRDRSGPLYLSHLEQRRFGLREGIWRVLDLLERFDIRGSFYVPGAVAEAHPYLLPRLIAGGHEVGLHGWFHEFVTEISDAEFSEALERSLDLFHRQTGQRPPGLSLSGLGDDAAYAG
ncbi:polysaccharide deacetylase family protein [Falsigemmobacter intermedius]|uniref:polysaccharide deacetylase family protein n=1 Tax=Falsigemmobacter intermedius TaxID=1553448 RepID=UPI00361A8BAF